MFKTGRARQAAAMAFVIGLSTATAPSPSYALADEAESCMALTSLNVTRDTMTAVYSDGTKRILHADGSRLERDDMLYPASRIWRDTNRLFASIEGKKPITYIYEFTADQYSVILEGRKRTFIMVTQDEIRQSYLEGIGMDDSIIVRLETSLGSKLNAVPAFNGINDFKDFFTALATCQPGVGQAKPQANNHDETGAAAPAPAATQAAPSGLPSFDL